MGMLFRTLLRLLIWRQVVPQGSRGGSRARRLYRRVPFVIRAGRLVVETIAIAIATLFGVVALTAGITIYGPGPRWLAIVFLVAGAAALLNAVLGAFHARRAVTQLRSESHVPEFHVVDESDTGA